MQIRIANRQDEKRVQALNLELCQECGGAFDLDQKDRDLKHIETNYMGKDGIFLVVEQDKQVVGFAGANKESDDLCVVRRIGLAKSWRRKGLGRQMLRIMLWHAQRMGFNSVAVRENPFRIGGGVDLDRSDEHLSKFFLACGFPRLESALRAGQLPFAPYVFSH